MSGPQEPRHRESDPQTALVRAARSAGVRDERVLGAVASVPRDRFVLAEFAADITWDQPFPIGDGQTTSQPSLIARMVEALDVQPWHKVLEVGTGLGYEAAILAQLARQVCSVERVAALAESARHRLRDAGVGNVVVVAGDGSLGLPEQAPFDGIIVAAATADIPAALVDQLRDGGRLVVPFVSPSGEEAEVYEKGHGRLRRTAQLCPVRFVPLVSDAAERRKPGR